MDRRLIALVVAGIVILGLVLYEDNYQRHVQSLPPAERPLPRRSAPAFQLFDQHQPSQFVKFERYLGRTKLLLVFFDEKLGMEQDPIMQELLRQADPISQSGVQIVAVSLIPPSQNRAGLERLGLEKSPFPLLTDVDINGPIPAPAHRAYGLFDEMTGQVSTGMFLIDRKQTIAMDTRDGRPYPVDHPFDVISELAAGRWPKETFQTLSP